MTPAMLRRLLELAEARKAADLARLDRLTGAVRACEAQIAEAIAALAGDLAQGGAGLPPLQQGLRLAWVDASAAQARRRREGLMIEIAAARAAAIQSLGKARALEHLVERADRAAAALRIARVERESPPPGS